jgi:hypothetical protein
VLFRNEVIRARALVASIILAVFLIGGAKLVFSLFSFSVVFAVLGYLLLRYMQQNAVSVDDDGTDEDLQPARIDMRRVGEE